MSPQDETRRSFLKKAATGLAATTAPLTARAADRTSASGEQTRMGFIGIGNRGTQLLHRFMANPDVKVTALCDVYDPYLQRDYGQVHPRWKTLGGRIPKMGEAFDPSVRRYRDFRELLADPNVDAVCIGTPDHWHAIQAILAIEAGKDVYVEKPLTIAVREGRRMIEAWRASDRVVQVGLNRRGSAIYQELSKQVPGGLVGPVSVARAYRNSNMAPHGIGRETPEAPPRGLDWDLWLGPRTRRSFQYNITPYKFRWWHEYSSQMANWGVHYMDVCRWMMGEEAPVAVTAHGSKVVVQDDRTIPDTMEVTFEMASGAVITFGMYEANGGAPLIDGGEVELRGTLGSLVCTERGYRTVPATPGQFQSSDGIPEPVTRELEQREDSSAVLIRNFLDCVKSRDQDGVLCNLEEGHRSTCFALLANIALARGRRLEWDADAERVTNDPEANDLLDYTYRAPWGQPA